MALKFQVKFHSVFHVQPTVDLHWYSLEMANPEMSLTKEESLLPTAATHWSS